MFDEQRIREIVREELALTRVMLIPPNEYSGLTMEQLKNKMDDSYPSIRNCLSTIIDQLKVT